MLILLTTAVHARDHLELHNKIATDILKKPLVLEEFGLPRDHEKYSPDAPTTARDEYYRRMFGLVIESCQKGRSLQAANFWAGAAKAVPPRPPIPPQPDGRPALRTPGLELRLRHRHQHQAVIARAFGNSALLPEVQVKERRSQTSPLVCCLWKRAVPEAGAPVHGNHGPFAAHWNHEPAPVPDF